MNSNYASSQPKQSYDIFVPKSDLAEATFEPEKIELVESILDKTKIII